MEGGEEAPPAPTPAPPLTTEELEERKLIFTAAYEGVSTDACKVASRAERFANRPSEDFPEGLEGAEAAEAAAAATAAKAKFEAKAKSLAYGEVELEVLNHLLNEVKKQDLPLYPGKGVFLDFGSGAGKSCLAASLLHPFAQVIGIECVGCLHDLANQAFEKHKSTLPEGTEPPPVQYIKGDFVDASEAEGGQVQLNAEIDAVASKVIVCFAVSTSWATEQLQVMATLATKIPDGAYFIAIGQGLPDAATFGGNRHPLQRRAKAVKEILKVPGTDASKATLPDKASFENAEPFGWVQVHTQEVPMPWGSSQCFIYKKIPGAFTAGNSWGLASWGAGSGPWAQLVGLRKEEALQKLKSAREDLVVELLEPDPETGKVPEISDVNEGRVVIRYDLETGRVVEAPKVG